MSAFRPVGEFQMPKITILRQSCKGIEDCGICRFVCPKHLFEESKELNEAGYLPPEIKDESLCTACENCMIYCPDFAIVVEKDGESAVDKDEDEDESR
jgi:2-oxoglutarate ferredoxin oxidoreductase subunit delta